MLVAKSFLFFAFLLGWSRIEISVQTPVVDPAGHELGPSCSVLELSAMAPPRLLCRRCLDVAIEPRPRQNRKDKILPVVPGGSDWDHFFFNISAHRSKFVNRYLIQLQNDTAYDCIALLVSSLGGMLILWVLHIL